MPFLLVVVFDFVAVVFVGLLVAVAAVVVVSCVVVVVDFVFADVLLLGIKFTHVCEEQPALAEAGSERLFSMADNACGYV